MLQLSVSETITHICALLESDDLLADLWVSGEISNMSRASSGHCYFNLREGNSIIHAVMWRSYAQRAEELPQNGDAVLAHGRVSLYEARGDLQLIVDMIRPVGEGIIAAQLAMVRARLAEEGIFDERHKRPLPAFPRRIGLITSPTGAALHDILSVLARRCPIVEVVLIGCAVQGDEAVPTIVAALERMTTTNVDVIILARGGGSIEDLWAFNEEAVVRAVFACPIPLITGVGHETDTTLVDEVADRRAPTPSVAAELAVPDRDELAALIDTLRHRATEAYTVALDEHQHALAMLQARARRAIAHALATRHTDLQQLMRRFVGLHPETILARGYALVRRHDDRSAVTSVGAAPPGTILDILVHDGIIQVQVLTSQQQPPISHHERASQLLEFGC